MAPTTHGYSGKPLYKKLGMKPGLSCLTINAPPHYADLIEGVEDVQISNRLKKADIVHVFAHNITALMKAKDKALASVRAGGMVWFSWPKKSSSLFIDLTEDTIRTLILPTGWVDTKVCAVDSDWSALKFLKRKT